MSRVDDFLAGLSKAELAELRTKVLFLLRRVDGKKTSAAEELYDEIRELLLSRGVAAPPYSGFKRMPLRKRHGFEEAAKTVESFVREHLDATTKLKRMQAYRVLVRTIERRLATLSIPLSLSTMLGQLPKLPALVELDYPGYLASGMLPQVLLRRRSV